jgi:hypothetical protein
MPEKENIDFGSVEVVKITISADEGCENDKSEDEDLKELITESLKTANNKIKTKLKKHSIGIPSSDITLDSVANYYACADSLAPQFTSNEDENHETEYYNSRAMNY